MMLMVLAVLFIMAVFCLGALFGGSMIELDHRKRPEARPPLCELAEGVKR